MQLKRPISHPSSAGKMPRSQYGGKNMLAYKQLAKKVEPKRFNKDKFAEGLEDQLAEFGDLDITEAAIDILYHAAERMVEAQFVVAKRLSAVYEHRIRSAKNPTEFPVIDADVQAASQFFGPTLKKMLKKDFKKGVIDRLAAEDAEESEGSWGAGIFSDDE